MNKRALFLVIILLQGCSALNVASAFVPSKGLEVSAQVGKEANKQIIAGDQVKIEGDGAVIQTMDTAFSGDLQASSFTINNMPTVEVMGYGALCIFFLGVLFPSPFEMWRGARNQIRRINGSTNTSNRSR